MEGVIFQFITFNPVEVNGIKTFDNMFIVMDNEDKIGTGMMYPKEVSDVRKEQ